MTEITFYFNAPDKLSTARVLAAKASSLGKRTLIYASDARLLATIDALLWTAPHTGFLPHCRASDRHAGETPVLLTGDADALPHHEILLNLDVARHAMFSRFDRVIEIVSRDDADDRAGARERFRFYRDRGYPITRHDLSARSA